MWRSWGQLVAVVLLLSAAGWSAPSDPVALIRSADALVAQRKYDRARTLYERALAEGARFDNDLPHVRSLAAAYLHSTPPDLPGAIQWLRIALTLEPHDDGLRGQFASALLRNGEVSDAIENYRILVETHPQSAESVIGLANALRAGGESDAALRLLKTSVERFPNLVLVRGEYARMLNFAKQFTEAKQQFSAVLAGDPQNLIAQIGVAKATSFAGDQESAIAMYDRVLQRHPGLYDAIVGKAFALLWAGRPERAAPLLAQGLRMHPEDGEVRAALRDLPAVPGSAAAGKRHPKTKNSDSASASVAPKAAPSLPLATVPEPWQLRWRSLIFLLMAALAAIIAGHGIIRGVWRSASPVKLPAQPRVALPLQPVPATEIAGLQSPDPPISKGEGPNGQQATRPRLQALLIGGPESLLALESRWLPNFEVRCAYDWEPATSALQAEPADLLVLNPITHDAWTSSRMLDWMATHDPSLLNRTLAVFSTGNTPLPEDPRAHWLLQPFSAAEWRGAVVAVLQGGFPVPPARDALVRATGGA